MPKVTPKPIDQTYSAIRSKLGASLGGSSLPVPPPPPPGIVAETNDGVTTGRIQTMQFDVAPSSGGFTLGISGTVALVGLQPIFLLLDGSRPMLGDLDMGGFDLEDHGAGGLNDIVTMRDIVSMNDVTTMHDITNMNDIVTMRDVQSMRDVIDMRDIQEMRDILEVRDVRGVRGEWFDPAHPEAPHPDHPDEGWVHWSYDKAYVPQARGFSADEDFDETRLYLDRKLVVRAFADEEEGDGFGSGDVVVIQGDATGDAGNFIRAFGLADLAQVKLGQVGVVSHAADEGALDVVTWGPTQMDTSEWPQGSLIWFDGTSLTATEPPVDGVKIRVRIGVVLVDAPYASDPSISGWIFVMPDEAQFERKDEKGVAHGYAPLDARAQVPAQHVPLSHHYAQARSDRHQSRPSLVNYYAFMR